MEKKLKKIAGFSISPGEIGYSVGVETPEGDIELVKCGVCTFADGARHDEKGEHSMCADRCDKRGARRNLARKRLRKIETLRVLTSLGFCPSVPDSELEGWRYGKHYPDSPEFRHWLSTDLAEDRNPYRDRYLCATTKLDFSREADRWCFGRAIYHMCQRRGYLSNARNEKRNNKAGKVNKGISALSKAIEESGCPTLGAYFYRQIKSGERVRGCYTGREVHYAAEFNYICDMQGISGKHRQMLYDALFFHRPLKSQKGKVGHCVFESGKFRIQRSHPSFEEYRMWSLLRNVKVKVRGADKNRGLTDEEIERAAPLFYRSKETFHFEEIARAVAGKEFMYGRAGGDGDFDLEFNYRMDVSVPGNATIHQIIAVLGKDSGADWTNWKRILHKRYARSAGKDEDAVVDDVWHAIMFFQDPGKLRTWFSEYLGAGEKELDRIAAFVPDDQYSSVSLCAVRKILPYLRLGYRFDEAVFFANLAKVLPVGITSERFNDIRDGISSIMDDFDRWGAGSMKMSKEEAVISYLRDACPDACTDKLYHPSNISKFEPATIGKGGAVILGNPDNGSIRNPVVHRVETEFRKLVNGLSLDGIIDPGTAVNIMVSTELNGKNERRGIAKWQKEREELRSGAVQAIRDFFAESGGKVDVSEDQITKYLLWEEQKHVCLYTGREIKMDDFLGPNASFDIEHTVPVSRGGDDSLMNKTLCDSVFNRHVKKDRLPSELAPDVYKGILDRIAALGWEKEYERMASEFEKNREKAKRMAEPGEKDSILSLASYQRHGADYWGGKLLRIKMKVVPFGFANSQGAAGKMARSHIAAYLKTGYRRVFSVSEDVVKGYRQIWGLPSNSGWNRKYHSRNCIDAMVLMCLSHSMYNEWGRYWRERDGHAWVRRPEMRKPWPTFTEDVISMQSSLLVRYGNRDNFSRDRKHKLRDNRGKLIRDAQGNPIYQNSSCVGGVSLHKDTYYSCRKDKDGRMAFGIRKSVESLSPKDIENIVDEDLRRVLSDAVAAGGIDVLKDFVYHGNKLRHVRVNAKNRPYIALTKHRDCGPQEHRNYIYVENDSNYCVAMYEGNRMEVINSFTAIGRRNSGEPVIRSSKDGNPLRAVMKVGTMVLFYQENAEELYGASRAELARRLYYLKSFSSSSGYCYLTFKHVAERNIDRLCEFRKGAWKNDDGYRPIIKMSGLQFTALIEGVDFEINRQGDIFWH